MATYKIASTSTYGISIATYNNQYSSFYYKHHQHTIKCSNLACVIFGANLTILAGIWEFSIELKLPVQRSMTLRSTFRRIFLDRAPCAQLPHMAALLNSCLLLRILQLYTSTQVCWTSPAHYYFIKK